METKTRRAFSLVEVVIALAVTSFALVAILALLPQGVQSANSSVSDTRCGLIAQDVALRLRTIPGTLTSITPAVSPSTNFPSLTTNWWYDINGRYLGTNYATALYLVSAHRAPLNAYPPNTNPTNQDPANAYSSELEAATVIVGWPVNTSTGALPPATVNTNTYTFYLRVVPNS